MSDAISLVVVCAFYFTFSFMITSRMMADAKWEHKIKLWYLILMFFFWIILIPAFLFIRWLADVLETTEL